MRNFAHIALATTCLLLATDALAEPGPNFWQRMAITKAREVEDALSHAKELYKSASRPIRDERDEDLRIRMLNDARGMLRFAIKIQPDNLEVIEYLAMVEEAAGRVQSALSHYEKAYAGNREKPMSGDACVHYGLLLARADRRNSAALVLRRCVSGDRPSRRSLRDIAIVNLSNLYAAQGQLERAIEFLERERVATRTGVAAFALAVLCDKDQQLNRAYELLQRQQQMDQNFVTQITRELGKRVIVPAEDRHYYMALLLEARGSLSEAREEWYHYIRSGDQARFAERAVQHIAAIDAMLAEQHAAKK